MISAQQWLYQAGVTPIIIPDQNTVNLYHFLFNNPINSVDYLGNGPACSDCTVSATLKLIKVTPVLDSTGKRAKEWDIVMKIDYTITGHCSLWTCKYWTCDMRKLRSDPTAWSDGDCSSWKYEQIGDNDGFNDDWHSKAIAGKLVYLDDCDTTLTPHEVDAGLTAFELYFKPPVANNGPIQVYP